MGILADNFAFSAIIVIASFVLLLTLSLKGHKLLFSALCASIVASFACQGCFIAGLTGEFASGFSTLVTMMFLVVMSGAFMASVIEHTGTGQKLGDMIVGRLGEKYVIISLIFYVIALTYLGIGISIFVFYAIAMPICNRANISKAIPFMVFMGGNAVMVTAWGAPSISNNVLSGFYGTNIYAAPLLSVTTTVVGLVLLFIMCSRELKISRANGEGFIREGETLMLKPVELRPTEKLPSGLVTIAPCLLLLVAIPLLQNFTDFGPGGSTIVAQLIAGLVMILLNWKRFEGGRIKTITESLLGPVPMLISAFCVAGYGAIISSTLFYQGVVDATLNSGLSPYLLLVVLTAVVCGITGDAAGGSALAMTTVGARLVADGVNPGVLLRLTSLASQTFDSLPHSYMVNLNLGIFGFDIKSGYKYAFRTTVLLTCITTIVGLVIAMIAY